ncbi:hypothetical protein DV532_30075 (plasmid) [Pseudomonas sp. Leaf58]|uniref:hypothetical protein n=1 Tax=unclassified Pseudomonas TaxID=196821 RepID=UPI0006FC62B2|nr:hypothetical protein [Pseudomonas sp. Leaf58]AYG48477.1 hypothetical protein DV532_30075 [Pseudomonas sp. Leaf58]KQN61979.1 hypothetical protein ASF02_07260 [Pseudomonas sp. Leaf58]
MNTLTYIDPMYSSKASISFGQFMLSVNIEGLKAVNFVEPKLPELLPHASAEAIATMLSMSNAEQWMIELNFEQTLSRMAEAFRMKDFPAIAEQVEGLRVTHPDTELRPYWAKVIRPGILDKAAELGLDTSSEDFNAVLTWAHPANTSRRLHPRAIRFISHGFPDLLSQFRSGRSSLIKSA